MANSLPMHVLLVTIDTLRADYVCCYGQRKTQTPNLDGFAASGVRFERHLSSNSSTLSSHTSLMTGCTPALHGVTWNDVTEPGRRRTLAELFSERGFATSAITSVGVFQEQNVFGFEYAYSRDEAEAPENRGDHTLQRVLDWLAEADGVQSQLLWVHFMDPHAPDDCPEPYSQTYEGEVAFVDDLFGTLLKNWDQRFGCDDCLTVVTADHGEHLGDHGSDRGHGTLWQTNLWVPLMVRAPRMIAPGTVVKELTRQIDVLPTILDYCGVPMPHNVEGASLRGLIEGTEDGLRLVHQARVNRYFTALP